MDALQNSEEFLDKGNWFSQISQTNSLKWIDTHRSSQCSIEWFLSKLFFNNDLTRVVYTTQDKAFQKRINLLDKEKNADGILRAESLDLPYACYWQQGDPEPDDRMASVNASQAVSGIYYETEDLTMRSTATKTKYKVVCFFSRRDEIREAYHLLFQEHVPSYPIHMYTTVMWRNIPIELPTNITIENVTTNPDYKETEWLTKNRIFMMEIEMTVRSYNLLINNVGKVIQLPIRFGNIEDTFEEDEEHVDYFTEEVILKWAPQKFGLNFNTADIDKTNPEYIEKKWKLLKDSDLTDDEKEHLDVQVPNRYTTDIIKAYFEDDPPQFDMCEYLFDEEKSTPYSAHIKYKFDIEQTELFGRVIFSIPTKEDVIVYDVNQTEIDFPNLHPNSEYKMSIRLFDKDDHLTVYNLKFKTPNCEENHSPQPERINFFNGLVGMHI